MFAGLSLVGTWYKSSNRRCSTKEDVLRNFAKSTGKHLCQSLFFDKLAGFWKKNLRHRCFPMNFAKFLRLPFLQNTFRKLLLMIPVFYWNVLSNCINSVLNPTLTLLSNLANPPSTFLRIRTTKHFLHLYRDFIFLNNQCNKLL